MMVSVILGKHVYINIVLVEKFRVEKYVNANDGIFENLFLKNVSLSCTINYEKKT